jgi:hemoglobin
VISFYDRVGGAEIFEKLTAAFYQGVKDDPLLRPMYPDEDLGPAERRLRMRHAPFQIGPKAREAWLRHMRAAVNTLELSPADEAELWDYLERAAHAMLNTFEG